MTEDEIKQCIKDKTPIKCRAMYFRQPYFYDFIGFASGYKVENTFNYILIEADDQSQTKGWYPAVHAKVATDKDVLNWKEERLRRVEAKIDALSRACDNFEHRVGRVEKKTKHWWQ